MINLEKIGWQNGTLISKAKVQINGQIYEVEPEEYEGTTPLSAENLTQMENNTEEAINEVNEKIPDIYSTEEVKTNKVWIDGKPVYRKVINFTVSDIGEKNIEHNIQNVERIWLGSESFLLSEPNHIPLNHYRNDGAYIWSLPNKTHLRIRVGANGWTNNPIYATLEYTKTID